MDLQIGKLTKHEPYFGITLHAQSSEELGLRQTCHEIAEKSSKIVPPGAPLLTNKTKAISMAEQNQHVQVFFAGTPLVHR
jgi:hypothetical protein